MIADKILSLLPWLIPALFIVPTISAIPLVNLTILTVGVAWAFLLVRYRKEDDKFKKDKEQISQRITEKINSLKKRMG